MRDTGAKRRRLMMGVDRLDCSKGLVNRFRAHERFLELHPDNHGRIDGRFAETDWAPIRHLNRNFAHEVLMGFLRAAQVGLAHADDRGTGRSPAHCRRGHPLRR